MSNLATRLTTQLNAINQPEDLIATLPAWLQMLIGSYPAAKVNRATFMAYDAMFADEDPKLMVQIVKTAVRVHKYHTFPTIGELSEILKQQKASGADQEQAELSARAAEIRRTYQKRRQYLKEQAYRGQYNRAAFMELYEDLIFAGLRASAVSLQAFMDRYEVDNASVQ